MNETYVRENAAERERLFRLTDRLTEQDLARSLPNGWSVATTLAHLAFWDRYYLALVHEWQRMGFAPVPAAVDAINEAVHVVTSTIPPACVIQLVRDAAEVIDREVEGLRADLATTIDVSGYQRILRRSLHRREHLDQIEGVLGKP